MIMVFEYFVMTEYSNGCLSVSGVIMIFTNALIHLRMIKHHFLHVVHTGETMVSLYTNIQIPKIVFKYS